ncbi:MAG: sigma-70 family RNA polymerase sigma factor [Planctomycetota bacterium]
MQTGSDKRQLLDGHRPLARKIARKLHRRYHWLVADEVHSYAWMGLAKAAEAYESDRGVPFANFAMVKGAYYAIDEMRRDGLLKRKRDAGTAPAHTPIETDLPDPQAPRDRRRMENRDVWTALMMHLPEPDRCLLTLYYHNGLTFREIAEILGISESAACIRHGKILRRLRKIADQQYVA